MSLAFFVLTSLLATGTSPCHDPGRVTDQVRAQRLQGELAEAQLLARETLRCEQLAPEITIALHLELARILDRFGLHRNTRPVLEALPHLEEAAALISHPSPAIAAAVELGKSDYHYRAEMSERQFPLAIQHAEAAIRLFQEAGDQHGEADAVHRLGLIHFQRRELQKARQLFDRSLELDDTAGSRTFFRGEYNRHVAFIHVRSNDIAAAVGYFQRSLQNRKEAGAVDASLFAAVSLASALVDIGRAPEALEPLLYAWMIAEKIDSGFGKSLVGIVLGQLYEALDDQKSAEHAYTMTLALARAIDRSSIVRQAEEALALLATRPQALAGKRRAHRR